MYEALNNLKVFCDELIQDCQDRKQRLTDALIWNDIGPAYAPGQELVNLQEASPEAAVMRDFYENLGKRCNDYYTSASETFGQDVELFAPYIDHMGDHKYMLMKYARTEFQDMKDHIFVIVDALRDSQRVIESTEEYFYRNSLRKMERKADDPKWKFQLKYSTYLTKRCAFDHEKVTEFSDALDTSAQVVAQAMVRSGDSFGQAAGADLRAWNCDEMYPQPI